MSLRPKGSFKIRIQKLKTADRNESYFKIRIGWSYENRKSAANLP